MFQNGRFQTELALSDVCLTNLRSDLYQSAVSTVNWVDDSWKISITPHTMSVNTILTSPLSASIYAFYLLDRGLGSRFVHHLYLLNTSLCWLLT